MRKNDVLLRRTANRVIVIPYIKHHNLTLSGKQVTLTRMT